MELLGLFTAIVALATAILLMPLIIYTIVETKKLKKGVLEDERNS